jgi:hypothetical protein
MSSILAKINLTAHASFLNTQCWTNTASSQLRARFFQTSQLWCRDAVEYNARRREQYANDLEYRQRILRYRNAAVTNAKSCERYAEDLEYRKMLLQAYTVTYRENCNNKAQKHSLSTGF